MKLDYDRRQLFGLPIRRRRTGPEYLQLCGTFFAHAWDSVSLKGWVSICHANQEENR